MAGKGPSPFNPGAQMSHFLRRMGFQYSAPDMRWYAAELTRCWWTQEELERWWAETHPMQDELTMLAAIKRPEGPG